MTSKTDPYELPPVSDVEPDYSNRYPQQKYEPGTLTLKEVSEVSRKLKTKIKTTVDIISVSFGLRCEGTNTSAKVSVVIKNSNQDLTLVLLTIQINRQIKECLGEIGMFGPVSIDYTFVDQQRKG